MKNKIILYFSIFILAAAGALAGAPRASAATSYPIPKTSTLSVISPDGSKNFSVAENLTEENQRWYNRAYTASTGNCEYKDNFQTQFTSGGYRAVSQLVASESPLFSGQYNFHSNSRAVLVFWDNDSNRSLDYVSWGSDGAYLAPTSDMYDNSYFGFLTIDNSGNYRFDCNRINATGSRSFASLISPWSVFFAGRHNDPSVGTVGHVYYVHFNINWYSFDPDPELPTNPPLSESNLIPAFGWTLSNNKLDVTHYKRNLPLDYSSPNTGYGFRFNLYQTGSDYDISTLGEEALLDSKLTNLQGYYSYSDLPVGYYVLTIDLSVTPPAAPKPEIKQVVFKIQNIGQFVSGSTDLSECTNGVCEPPPIFSLASCFKEEFPFVDVDACSADMKGLIYLLSFKTVTFGERPSVGDCTTLTVFDNWLNIQNSVVCAQFPESIRNIVTPFITFLLGLLMMKFLVSKEGYIT